jgi:hypothetical protein
MLRFRGTGPRAALTKPTKGAGLALKEPGVSLSAPKHRSVSSLVPPLAFPGAFPARVVGRRQLL